MMNTLLIFIFIIFLVGTTGFLFLGYLVVKSDKKMNDEKQKKELKYAHMDYSEVISIVSESILLQFRLKYHLDYKIKQVCILSDLDSDLREISKNVLMSFSESVYQNIDYYFERESFYKFVVGEVEIKLLELQREIKPTVR